VGWIAQLLPFQRSASATPTPAPVVSYPTAVHSVVDGQATPRRKLPVAPDGLGLHWIVQLVPPQRSASVTVTPELLVYAPTAMQSLADGQATPERLPVRAPEGFAAGWSTHPGNSVNA